MKVFILKPENAHEFADLLQRKMKDFKSVVFPESGHNGVTKNFRRLRKEARENPMALTTHKVSVSVEKRGVVIKNPLNRGFGYADLLIPFTGITIAFGSYFWKDEDGFWRQMTFSKNYGWALVLSGGRTTKYVPDKDSESEAVTKPDSRQERRLVQFLSGTGDW